MSEQKKPSALAQRFRGRQNVFTGASENLPRVIEVDIVKLRPNPDQPRTTFDEVNLKELAASIERSGLIQPISVSQDADNHDGYSIVAGERRFRAFQLLGRETIPAILTSGDPAEIALIENIQREDLHPMDEADALFRLMEKHSYRQEDVSRVVGKSLTVVNELLRLRTLPQNIQDEFRTSEIPKSTLVELSRVNDPDELAALWEEVKTSGMTVRIARSRKQGETDPPPRSQSMHSINPVLKSGMGFIQRLQKATTRKKPLDTHTVRELHVMREQIDTLLSQLSRIEASTGDDEQGSRSDGR